METKSDNGYVYLIKQEKFLKIGFTTDIDKRMKYYHTHNANFELLFYIIGSKSLEKELHSKFHQFRYNNEWFYYCDEIIDFFRDNRKENHYMSKCIKHYYDNMQPFYELNSKVASDILYQLIEMSNPKTGVFFLNKEKRMFLTERFDITKSQLSRAMKKLTYNLLITPLGKDIFMINPYVFWCGNEKDMSIARKKFYSINSEYMNILDLHITK